MASGPTSFEMTCGDDGQYSGMGDLVCHPVKCSTAPHVENSKYNGERQYVFEDEVEYKCDNGYSTTAKVDGDKFFKAKSIAEGAYDNVFVCDFVECPAIPKQPNAEYPEDAGLVYLNKVPVTCDVGHALNAQKHDDTKYVISCEADGELASMINSVISLKSPVDVSSSRPGGGRLGLEELGSPPAAASASAGPARGGALNVAGTC